MKRIYLILFVLLIFNITNGQKLHSDTLAQISSNYKSILKDSNYFNNLKNNTIDLDIDEEEPDSNLEFLSASSDCFAMIDTFCCHKTIDYKDFELFTFNKNVIKNTINEVSNDTLLKSFIIARSAFPELNDVVITLKFKRLGKNTMNTRPSYNPFTSKNKRKYNININNLIERNGISYKDFSFNILIGWFSHEISHILDYKNRSGFNLIIYGICYELSKKFMKEREYYADSTAISHCVGCQLIEGVVLSMSSKTIRKSYKLKLIKYYMSPRELFGIIKNNYCNQLSVFY